MFSQVDRQIFKQWRARTFGGVQPSPRVAVVGNCQSFGLAYGMKLFNSSLKIDRYALVGRSHADLNLFAKTLATYDLVFAQDFGPGILRDNGDSEALRAILPDVRRLPFVNFSGFHPDTVYIFDPTRNGAIIDSAAGVYHSAIVLFAFHRGMSVDQTEAMFAHEVFDYLGYLSVWDSAAQEVLQGAQALGMDLSNDFARWARRGNFMYTPNHPKPQVLFDVARNALKAAGVALRDVNADDYLVDDLARGYILPVYPPLAELYGIRGSTLFKKELYRISFRIGEFLTLREYIAGCFDIYGKHQKAQLANPRVEGWLSDEETVRTLSVLSAEAMKRRALAA